TFLREALARVGVRAELHAIGEYKSAAELLTRDQMSEPNREATSAIVDDLLARLVAWTAEARKRERAAAQAALLGGPYVGSAAVAAGLCDGLLYEDELAAHLGAQGAPARLERAQRFARVESVRFRWRPLVRTRRKIAVVSIEGIIAA